MPRPGYVNLTINDPKRLASVKRMFETYNASSILWIDWVIEVLDSGARRDRWLQDSFPYLRFVGYSEKGFVLEDKRTKELVTIKVRKGKFEASKKGEDYIIFASVHPAMRF